MPIYDATGYKVKKTQTFFDESQLEYVVGFLTEDQTFFESRLEAEYYDAQKDLVEKLILADIKHQVVLQILTDLYDEIRRYLNARQEYSVTNPKLQAYFDPTDNGEPEGRTLAVQQQPPNGDQSMPDVGGYFDGKAIRDERSSNGAGSGESNARSVRRGADMAVEDGAEIAEARTGSGQSNIREGSVGEVHQGSRSEVGPDRTIPKPRLLHPAFR